jgi:hypothetical protein
VLSACATGLGDVAGGEGVFGLQRAFHQAGARTVVASLWQVDDEAARQVLTRFYENLWRKGLGPLAALRQAQLAHLREGPADSSHPRYWAAWVLSGDPGDLGSAPSAVPGQLSEAVAAAPWWSGWPVYATGLGVVGVVMLALVVRWPYRRSR